MNARTVSRSTPPGTPSVPGWASVDEVKRKDPDNRDKRIRRGACEWCGRRIRRRPGSRGPLPASCARCAERVQVRRRLRAYLRSSRRYALRLHRWDLAGEIGGLLRVLEGSGG